LSVRFGVHGPTVDGVHLTVVVRAPGLDDGALQRMALQAKEGCTVSRVLNASITMEARLGE